MGTWFFFFLTFYFFYAVSLNKLAKKANVKNPWLAFIPVLQFMLFFHILDMSAWNILLFLIPIGNIVLFHIWWYKIYKSFNTTKEQSIIGSFFIIFFGYFHIYLTLIIAYSAKYTYVISNRFTALNTVQDDIVPIWFKHFNKGKMIELQTAISQMHPTDIKRSFKKSLNDSLLYGIRREYERAVAIYLASDGSLKEELDNISLGLQNKKIDINETIIDTFAMTILLIGEIAIDNKEYWIEHPEKRVEWDREEDDLEPQV